MIILIFLYLSVRILPQAQVLDFIFHKIVSCTTLLRSPSIGILNYNDEMFPLL